MDDEEKHDIEMWKVVFKEIEQSRRRGTLNNRKLELEDDDDEDNQNASRAKKRSS